MLKNSGSYVVFVIRKDINGTNIYTTPNNPRNLHTLLNQRPTNPIHSQRIQLNVQLPNHRMPNRPKPTTKRKPRNPTLPNHAQSIQIKNNNLRTMAIL